MAGDWIKLQKDTPDKPEVLAIASRLGIDPDAVVGKLVRVWSWFDTHTTNGNASCVTYSFLDRITGVTGFAEQMALTGWLIQNGHDLSLPHFDYHNGNTAKTRALTKNRVDKARSNADSNAPSVTKELPEKRREEKINTERASPNGSRLPPDWVMPEEYEAFCKAERPDLNPSIVACHFADYWHGVAGQKGRKADWLATWRNWVRGEKKLPSAVQSMTVPAKDTPLAVQVSDEHKARATPMPESLRKLTRGAQA